MSFRRGGAGKRRDANEGSLIAGWRAIGAEVWQVSGTGLPDVLVRFRGRLHAFEIKTATGRETEHQGDFEIIRTMDDALRAIGANAMISPVVQAPYLFDLHSSTLRDESRGADLRIDEQDSVRPGTEGDKPGDPPLTVEEWAEQMAPYFQEASQIAPSFGGGQVEKT